MFIYHHMSNIAFKKQPVHSVFLSTGIGLYFDRDIPFIHTSVTKFHNTKTNHHPLTNFCYVSCVRHAPTLHQRYTDHQRVT